MGQAAVAVEKLVQLNCEPSPLVSPSCDLQPTELGVILAVKQAVAECPDEPQMDATIRRDAPSQGDALRARYLSRLGIQRIVPSPPGCQHFGDARTSVKVEQQPSSQESGGPRLLGKDNCGIRLSLLRKLSYENVWVPKAQRPPTHQTVVIFDWDDTLLCTTYLKSLRDQPVPPAVKDCIQNVARAAQKLLLMALTAGKTFIITNAMSGWVENSAAKYMPELARVLQFVRVVSAREKCEAQFPDQVGEWKKSTFLEVQQELDQNAVTNLLALGDSSFEIEAARIMGREFAEARVKTVKFREAPSPRELLRQLEVVTERFDQIVATGRNRAVSLSFLPRQPLTKTGL